MKLIKIEEKFNITFLLKSMREEFFYKCFKP